MNFYYYIRYEAAMFNLKEASMKYEHTDKFEPIQSNTSSHNQLFNHVMSSPIYKQKKFAIFGTKISDSFNESGCHQFMRTESLEALNKNLEQPRATQILTKILSNNLNTFNQLINYNYKGKVKNHADDIIKNNRLNYLLGMRRNEKIFSVRPASLNDLNERLAKVYQQHQNQSQTKIIYNLSKKQKSKQLRSELVSASVESFKKQPGLELLKRLTLVECLDKQDETTNINK